MGGKLKTNPRLCGGVCVALAAGTAAHLKGRYIDVELNLQIYLRSDIDEEINRKDHHTLRASFVEGAPNDGGSSRAAFSFS